MHDHLISIVEDDPSVRSALVELMRSLGFETSAHASAEAMLATDNHEGITCVITDIQMPGLSGFDLKRTLVARGCHAPVIMITARTDEGMRSRALQAGAFCFLQKPFEASALLECLDRALSVA